MNILIYVVMFGMLVFIFMKNFKLLKRYKHNKEYIACYRDVLNETEGTYERINSYINNEKSDEYKNKGRILKLYIELKNNIDYTDSLYSLDVRKIFYNNKDLLDKDLINFNSDSFIFIMMILTRAYANAKLDVITEINEKMRSLKEMDKQVEYQEVLAMYDALLSKNDGGIEFMSLLISGGYTDYQYDKNLIGIYKRIAAAILIFKVQPLDDYYEEDLRNFTKTLIGKQILTDLRLYDKYIQSAEERSQE